MLIFLSILIIKIACGSEKISIILLLNPLKGNLQKSLLFFMDQLTSKENILIFSLCFKERKESKSFLMKILVWPANKSCLLFSLVLNDNHLAAVSCHIFSKAFTAELNYQIHMCIFLHTYKHRNKVYSVYVFYVL